jgi:hypothetical protein
MTTGATGHVITLVSINGTFIAPKWLTGTAPVTYPNSISAYSFTIVKTGTTYMVLGSMARYA